MVYLDILTSFHIDFTNWADVLAETDDFFSLKTGKQCLRLNVTNHLLSKLKLCFTDLFYVEWAQ